MSGLHVCPGPSVVIATANDDRKTRWCFKCRKHLPHSWKLMDDPPERQPFYYEPVPVVRCSGCGGSHTQFPGYEGPDYPGECVWAALVAVGIPDRSHNDHDLSS